MAAELKVGVGADVKDLEKGLKQGEQAVKQFAETSEKSLALTDKSVKTFSKTAITESKKTGVAFQGLSRVMSDAAFGPGAIANNLAGLGDDFKQLSLQAKESGQSIGKTLVQSLAGGGGLNLALGGLTLAMSLASFGLGAWTRMFGESDKKVQDSKDSLKDYLDTLEDVRGAQIKGTQNAQSELTELNLLFAAYKNANTPLADRQRIYKELQEKYPAYFGNLKFEKKATEDQEAANKRLVGSILQVAQAKAMADRITAISTEQVINTEKITDLEVQRLDLINKSLAVADQIKKINAGATAQTKSREAFAERIARLAQQQISYENQQAAVADQINNLKREDIKLDEKKLKLAQAINAVNLLDPPKPPAAVEPTFKAVKELPFMKALTGGAVSSATIPAPVVDFGPMKESFFEMKEFVIDLTNTINQSVFDTFNSLGDAIGNALATGGNVLEAIGQTMLASIGGILQQFGQLAIAAGVTALGLQAVFKAPLNPASAVAAIAAGTALVAIGSAVKAFSQKAGGGGSGGGFSSPGAPGTGFQPGAVQYAGGQQSNVFIPSMTLKGQDIVIAYNRTTALNGRMGK